MGVHKTFSDRKIARINAEFAEYKEKAALKALEMEREYRSRELVLAEAANNERQKHDAAMRALGVSFDRLRNELAAARDKLKAAEAAPAECRDYAAPPTQLSTLHATMVAELARAADEVVLERNTCFRQYEDARAQLDALQAVVKD
jgi:chromosome segregation ATPase